MSYYEGFGESAPQLATQNPYDGGVVAHDSEANLSTDADEIFGGLGSSFQEATGAFGQDFAAQAAAGVEEAAAGYDEAAAGFGGSTPMTQALAAAPRVYSGSEAMTQAQAGVGADFQVYQGYGAPFRTYSGMGAPFRTYSGVGAPFKTYSGFGITADEFDPDQMVADIKLSAPDAKGKYAPGAWQAGTRWAYRMKAALAMLGYGIAPKPEMQGQVSWGNDGAAAWKQWCERNGVPYTFFPPASRVLMQTIKDQLASGKVTGPSTPVDYQVTEGAGGAATTLNRTAAGTSTTKPGGISTANMLLIGGGVLALGLVGFVLLAKKREATAGVDSTDLAVPNKRRPSHKRSHKRSGRRH